MGAEVSTRVQGDIGWLAFSQPRKRNAVSVAMLADLPRQLQTLAQNPEILAVVLQGAGGTFGAGADLEDVIAATSDKAAAFTYSKRVVDAVMAIVHCPVPVLAAIEGVAAGVSVELALGADFRVAEKSARIILPFARLGIVPDDLTLRRLVDLVGASAARRILFFAEPLSATEARALGLIDEVCEDSKAAAAAESLATRLRGTARQTVMHIKAGFNNTAPITQEQATANMAQSLLTDEVRQRAQHRLQALRSK